MIQTKERGELTESKRAGWRAVRVWPSSCLHHSWQLHPFSKSTIEISKMDEEMVGGEKDDVYFLKWHTYSAHLTSGVQDFLAEGDFLTDVTLVAEGRSLRAHRFLLTLCSPHFKQLFQVIISSASMVKVNENINYSCGRRAAFYLLQETQQGPNANTIIILNNVRFQDLLNLLQFIYKGEVSVRNDEELQGFLQVGSLLQVQGLSKVSGDDATQIDDEDFRRLYNPVKKVNKQKNGGNRSIGSSVPTATTPSSVASSDTVKKTSNSKGKGGVALNRNTLKRGYVPSFIKTISSRKMPTLTKTHKLTNPRQSEDGHRRSSCATMESSSGTQYSVSGTNPDLEPPSSVVCPPVVASENVEACLGEFDPAHPAGFSGVSSEYQPNEPEFVAKNEVEDIDMNPPIPEGPFEDIFSQEGSVKGESSPPAPGVALAGGRRRTSTRATRRRKSSSDTGTAGKRQKKSLPAKCENISGEYWKGSYALLSPELKRRILHECFLREGEGPAPSRTKPGATCKMCELIVQVRDSYDAGRHFIKCSKRKGWNLEEALQQFSLTLH